MLFNKSSIDDMTDKEMSEIKNKVKCYDGPITGNIKCIVFSLILAALYWYLPYRNKYVLLFILYITYLVIAYYDVIYDCRRGQFGPTFLRTYYEWAKPKNSRQNIIYSNLCPENKRIILLVDIVVFILILLLAPYFIRWKPV